MNKGFSQLTKQMFQKLIELDDISIKLSDKMVLFIQILGALLNLSYLQPQEQHKYIYIVQLFARPQLYINSTMMEYFFLIGNMLYVIGIFFNIPGKRLISLYGGLMITNLLNFGMEISSSPICYILQPSLVMISGLNQLFLLETLDVENKNFHQTKILYPIYLIWIIQIVQSLLWYYNKNMIILNLIVLLQSSLQLVFANNFIIASIQLYTIIHTFSIILGFANNLSSLLIIFPVLLRITQYREQRNKQKDKQHFENNKRIDNVLIQISILIYHKQYQKALCQLQVIKDLNIYYEIKKERLKLKCLKQIKTIIFANQTTHQSFVDSINKVNEIEETSYYYIKELKSLMLQKLQLLQNVQEQNFDIYYEYLDKLSNIENILNQLYLDHSTQKNKAILLFFYAEIMNNFHQARILSHQSNHIQYDSCDLNKLAYLISTYDQGIKISGISNNSIFSKDSSQGIEGYIPPGIREHHNSIIEQFIETGISKYVKRFDASFIAKDNDLYMSSIDFGFNAIITDELKFITFIQVSIEQPMSMILNSQLQITCLSESLSSTLNISQIDFKHIGYNIKKFIPQYSETESYQENLELILSDLDQECPYVTTIDQQIKFIDNQPIYYILTFQYIRRSNYKQKSFTQLTYQQSIIEPISQQQEYKTRSDFDFFLQGNIAQEEQIDVPYDENDFNQQYLNDFIELQQMDDNTNIYSPDNKQQQKLKLLRKQTFASRLRKQHSLNIDQDEQFFINKNPKNSYKSRIKDFLSDYYNQNFSILNKFIFAFLLSLVVTFAFFLLQTIKVNSDINSLMDNLEVLDFSQLCFQPIENTLLVIFSLSEYNLYFLMKIITYQQLVQFVQFPSSQVLIGYNQIYSNFNLLFQQPLLQKILDDNQLEIYQYTNSSKEESYTMTLRNAFGTLLKFQYDIVLDFKMNGKVNADTAHIYFTFKNYIPLKQIVKDLHKDILEETINVVEDDIQIIIVLLIISIVSFTVPYLLSYYYFIGITNQISRYYNIILQLPQAMREMQIYQYKQMIFQINNDYEYIVRYKYNEQRFGKDKQKQSYQRVKIQNSLKYSGLRWKFVYLALYILILLKSGISFYLNREYLQGYKEIASFYKALSDLSIDISSMYSAREVLYFRTSFPYLQNNSISQLLQVIDEGLDRTKQFLEKQFIYDKVILSDEFQEYYDSLAKGDLCSLLSNDLQQQTSSFCQQLFNGNMKNGLYSTLTIITNSLKSELNYNQFQKRTSVQIYDLEGPYLISGIVSNLYSKMRQDMNIQTQELMNLMNVAGIALLSLLGVLILFSKIVIFNKLVRLFEISKMFISFIPIKMLLLDEGMERYVKNLMYKNNLS